MTVIERVIKCCLVMIDIIMEGTATSESVQIFSINKQPLTASKLRLIPHTSEDYKLPLFPFTAA